MAETSESSNNVPIDESSNTVANESNAVVETNVDVESNSIDSKVTPAQSTDQVDRSEILSKRAQKKIRKLAQWEDKKKIKRKLERQKQKERRKKEVELGIPGPCSKRKKLKLNKIDSSPNLVSVAIDFDYDDLMLDKDVAKCAKQLLRVYTENRKSEMPIRLHITSIRENSRIENALDRNDRYKNWDVKIHQESYYDLFDHNSIVYLTSDSDNVLNELDPTAVYIIGGLVDHNHHKGLSFERAEGRGFKTARLPLSEHIEMKTRSVLTIVHVFEILLRVSEGKPWKETLLEVLPQRKFRIGGKRKHKSNDSSHLDSDDEESIQIEPTPDEKSNENKGDNSN